MAALERALPGPGAPRGLRPPGHAGLPGGGLRVLAGLRGHRRAVPGRDPRAHRGALVRREPAQHAPAPRRASRRGAAPRSARWPALPRCWRWSPGGCWMAGSPGARSSSARWPRSRSPRCSSREYGRWLAWIVRLEGGTLWVSLKALAVAGLVLLLFLPLQFLVPGVGQLLFVGAAGFTTALSLLDIPFSRRQWSLRQRLRFLTGQLPAVVTFGGVASLVFVIPLIGPLLMVPAASVGRLVARSAGSTRPRARRARAASRPAGSALPAARELPSDPCRPLDPLARPRPNPPCPATSSPARCPTPTARSTSGTWSAPTCRPTSTCARCACRARRCSSSAAPTSTASRSRSAPSRRAAPTPSTSRAGATVIKRTLRPPRDRVRRLVGHEHLPRRTPRTSQEFFRRLDPNGYLLQAQERAALLPDGRACSSPTATSSAPATSAATRRRAATSARAAASGSIRCEMPKRALQGVRHAARAPRRRCTGTSTCPSCATSTSARGSRATSGSPTSTAFIGEPCCARSQPRPITRDMSWGVPVPPRTARTASAARCSTSGSTRRSATSRSRSEWAARRRARPEAWKHWWQSTRHAPRALHRQGQHPVPLPGLPVDAATGVHQGYVLPWQVPANEFYNLAGPEVLDLESWTIPLETSSRATTPRSARFYLLASAPETADSEWSWRSSRAAPTRCSRTRSATS